LKEKKRRGSTNLSDRDPLTKSSAQFSFKHPNRIRSKRKPGLFTNPGYLFYIDERGVCRYREKRRADE